MQYKRRSKQSYWVENKIQAQVAKAMFYAYYSPIETWRHICEHCEVNPLNAAPTYSQVQQFFSALNKAGHIRADRATLVKEFETIV